MLRTTFVILWRLVRWGLLGPPLALIGIAGVSEDLETWSRWIDGVVNDPLVQDLAAKAVRIAAFLNQGWIRTALTVAGLALLAWPLVLFLRTRRLKRNVPERIFVPASISLTDLAEPFKSHTQIEAQGLTAKYLGRWIRISGAVSQLSKAGLNAVLLVHTEHFILGPLAHMYFHGSQGAKAGMLRKGAPFAAIGRIAAVNHSGAMLEDCELEG